MGSRLRVFWVILKRAVGVFLRADGANYAASFAFYAFFSLFPLLLLTVSVLSMIYEKEVATEAILEALGRYLILDADRKAQVVEMVSSVLARSSVAGAVAVVGLVWSSLKFFKALLHTLNLAWGVEDVSMWKVPAKSLVLILAVVSALLLGMVAPTIFSSIFRIFPPDSRITQLLLDWALFVVPALVLFYALFTIYKFAPHARVPARVVWPPAMAVALILAFFRNLFVRIVEMVAGQFGVVYDGITLAMALMYGIYLAGLVIIFGGCFSAAAAGPSRRSRADG